MENPDISPNVITGYKNLDLQVRFREYEAEHKMGKFRLATKKKARMSTLKTKSMLMFFSIHLGLYSKNGFFKVNIQLANIPSVKNHTLQWLH